DAIGFNRDLASRLRHRLRGYGRAPLEVGRRHELREGVARGGEFHGRRAIEIAQRRLAANRHSHRLRLAVELQDRSFARPSPRPSRVELELLFMPPRAVSEFELRCGLDVELAN